METVSSTRPVLLAKPSVSLRALAAAALLVLGIALSQALSARHNTSKAGASVAARAGGLASLPVAALGPVSTALGAESPTYRVHSSAAGVELSNPAQRLSARFSEAGLRLRSGAIDEGLSLRAVGYGASSTPVGPMRMSSHANRVRYSGSGVTEWFANGPLGLEQGFTIARAPAAHAGPLTLAMELTGAARVTIASDAHSATIAAPGAASLRYGALSASDAGGRALRTWLERDGERLLLRVDARGARYPLQIDPLIQQSKLKGAEETAAAHFGRSVAISADGRTALVGGPRSEGQAGAAWVFTRTGTVWSEQAEIASTGGAKDRYFGRSVALSGDGDTALVGDPGGLGQLGSASVYTRSGTTWTLQQTLTGGSAPGAFGARVALSTDGSTAIVGGFAADLWAGAAWVFVRSGSTWSQQAVLHGAGGSGKAEFGRGVALSADGSTALIGGLADNGWVGAAWVFVRSGSTWSQQSVLHGAGEIGRGQFGRSVALSADGGTALIGGRRDADSVGAAWAFTRSGEEWAQQAKLTATDEVGHGGLGSSVALSADGNSALVGASGDNEGVGAAWQFARSGEEWAQQGSKLTAEGEGGQGSFGSSVALSPDASVALVGGLTDSAGAGAVWVFTTPAPTIVDVEPKEGSVAGGTTVTITGTGFTSTSTVEFGSQPATSVEVVSPTEIKAVTPPGSGIVDVTVGNAGGTTGGGTTGRFKFVAPAAPAAATAAAESGVLAFESTAVPPPQLGISGNIAPVSGKVLVKVPGTTAFVLLSSLRQVPYGTIVDATHGRVDLTSATTTTTTTQTGEFFAGEFAISQNRSGLVQGKLVGGSLSGCPKVRKSHSHGHVHARALASAKRTVRKLWANAHGKFSTKGNYASGAVQGTEWLTEDRCDGTLIKVTRDKVKVTDFVRHRSVIVKVGHSYFAKRN